MAMGKGIMSNVDAGLQKLFKWSGVDKSISRVAKEVSEGYGKMDTAINGTSTEAIESAMKDLGIKDMEKAPDEIASHLGLEDSGSDAITNEIKRRQGILDKGHNYSNLAESEGTFSTIGNVAADYYTGKGGLKHAALTYGGVALGARMLSGGTPISDSNGERDIVGIPFI